MTQDLSAIILSIGNELTTGQTVDTNTSWLAQRLAEVGITVAMQLAVPDTLNSIQREIIRASEMVPVLIITGGLGPTEDDLTRQALAQAMSVPLIRDDVSLEKIKAYFAAHKRTMHESNERQAMLPQGATAIENLTGTAPGIRASIKTCKTYVLPGVPREMKAMYERSLMPELSTLSAGEVTLSTAVQCFGASEAEMGSRIQDLMERGKNPVIGTNANASVISIRIHAHGKNREMAESLLNAAKREVQKRLGELVFGEAQETLAKAVLKVLQPRGETVATAEVFSGGLLASMLFESLKGGEVFSQHTPVSRDTTEQLAIEIRKRHQSDWSVSTSGCILEQVSGAEKPVRILYIAIAGKADCVVSELRLPGHLSLEEARDWACKAALNRLRLRIFTS